MSRRAAAFALALALPLVVWAESDPFILGLDQQAREHGPGAARIGDPVRGYATRTDWQVQLAPGSCYVIEARAATGVRRISLFLWSPDGKRAATDKPHGLTSSIRYCSTWLGSFHVQAKIEGAGPYVVGTYVLPGGKGAAGMPPPLVGSPYGPPPVVAAPVYTPPPPQPVYVAPQPVYVAPQPVYVAPAPQPTTVIIVPASTGGAMCRSSLDCGSGQFCKENSDGIHVCMGRGGRGAACSSSIDCDSGLFCKDRGDDFNVCM